MPAHLYLIPNTLADNSLPAYIGYYAPYIAQCSVFVMENIKPARRWLKQINPHIIIEEQVFITMEHNAENYLFLTENYFKQNINIGLISDAGLPCIADPGSAVVHQAHQYGYKVIPLIGGSALFLALMGSGLNGQRFAFKGYLPIDALQRKKSIRLWERRSREEEETQIFIETPYRNKVFFQDLVQVCNPNTLICVACNLTAQDAFIQTKSVAEWKKALPILPKQPCVFLLYAGR